MYCTYVRLCTVISGQEVGIMLIDSRSSSVAFYPNEVPRILQRHQMKAKTNVSKTKSRRGFTLVEMLVVIGMIAALAGISFPVYRSIQKKVEAKQFEMTMGALERAVSNFETEYNYLPYIGNAYPNNDGELRAGDGDITDFISVLVGYYSADLNANFKKIEFFECAEAKGSDPNFKNGLHKYNDGTAALFRPWGDEFQRMRLDYDSDGETGHPYTGAPTPYGESKMFYWDYGPDGLWYGFGGIDKDDVVNFEFPDGFGP